jgi:hypothetical protein
VKNPISPGNIKVFESQELAMKINRNSDFAGFDAEQMEQLRKELRERILREELQYSWQLEALDRIAVASQVDPATFHQYWIQPLLAAGLTPEAAVARIADSCFQPN